MAIVVVDAVVVVVVVAIAVIFYDSDLIWANFIVAQKLSNSTEIFFLLKKQIQKNQLKCSTFYSPIEICAFFISTQTHTPNFVSNQMIKWVHIVP